MKRLITATTITAILALAGCLQRIPRSSRDISETTTLRTPVAPVPSSESSGTLAYVGADGNVWITSPNEGGTQQVTTDATARPEGQGRSYHRIAWSQDGALAFAAVVRSGDEARGELFLQRAFDQPPQLVAQNQERFFIYLYSSPTSCPAQSECPLLAYLVEEENGVALRLMMREDGDVRDLLLAVGRPFYLSWSPDGRRILWHTGGSIGDNPAAEIGLYHIRDDRRRVLPYAPGAFLAPAWSPQGEQWLGVVDSNGIDRLLYVTADVATTLTTTNGQEIAFVWSPSGRRIAYAVRESYDPDSYGPIQLFDLETEETRQITKDAFNILGFFWSPDGRRLAYLSRLDLPDAVWMQWRTVDIGDDRDRGFTAFRPSPLMRFVVHSFSQYAQTHRFWSPDGRYLVYAERDNRGADRVWLVDTQAEKGSDPILVDEGSLGIWSWH